jgi:hypothetical protein
MQTTDVKVFHKKKNPAVSGGALRRLGIQKQTNNVTGDFRIC